MKTKVLGQESERRTRIAMLQQPHVAPLTELVGRIREDKGLGQEVPFFDPMDGGFEARALFVLEAPGKKAVESGFISRDNPDESAKNFTELMEEAGIPRTETALWNAVPWYIGTGYKVRAAGGADLSEGEPYLQQLVSLLPRLDVIVLVGRKAQRLTPIHWLPAGVDVLACPHPSPQYVNRLPGNRHCLLEALISVAARLGYRE